MQIKHSRMKKLSDLLGLLLLQLCFTCFPTRSSMITSPVCVKKHAPLFKTATNVNSFLALVEESTVFIDKTLLIKDFLNDKTPVIFLTCPSGWGKSVNMDMIRLFLQVEVDANGAQFQKEQTTAFKLFALNKTKDGAISKLKIGRHIDLIDRYLAKHPVIHVTFDSVTGATFREIFDQIKIIMADTFKKHLYAYKHLKIIQRERNDDELENQIEDFEKIFFRTAETKMEIQSSLYTLCEILSKFHGDSKVYVLLDGYDQPVTSILSKSDEPKTDDLKETIRFLWAMMSITFKNNDYLNRGFISGVDRINLVSFLAELNNMTDYNVFKNPYYEHYGFTDYELPFLFGRVGLPDKLARDSKNWLDGYRTCEDEDTRIYDPSSVISILNHGDLKNHKPRNGLLDDFFSKVFQFEKIRSMILRLLNGEIFEAEIDNLKIEEDEYVNLHKMLHENVNYKDGPNIASRLLFRTGFLTLAGDYKLWRKGGVKKDLRSWYYVKVPNKEIITEISRYFLKFIEKERYIKTEVVIKLEKDFKDIFMMRYNGTDRLKNSLNSYLQPLFVKSENETDEAEEWLHTATNAIILRVSQIQPVDSVFKLAISDDESENQKKEDSHVIIVNKQLKLGLIAVLRYNSSVAEAVDQAEKHVGFFKDRPLIQKIRAIGIHVTQLKTVDVGETWIK